jgi:endonuclease G
VLVLLVLVAVVLPRCARLAGPPRAPATSGGSGGFAPSEPVGSVAESPHVALGVPTDADSSDDVLLDERQFVVSYSPRRRDPNWVAWRLDSSYLGHVPRRDDFRPDESLPVTAYRVTSHDYARSGYDRGHLCPSADRDRDRDMNAVTFLMTNVVPQLHELNAGPWEKLEEYERRRASEPGAELSIVAGGVFRDPAPTIGHGTAVPSATYKIIVVAAQGQTARDLDDATEVIAVIMPNREGVGGSNWTDFVVSVDQIEEATGYDFLSRVPAPVQRLLEAKTARVP